MLTARLQDSFFRNLDRLECGQFDLTTPDGRTRVFGGRKPGPSAALTLRDWSAVRSIVTDGDIGFAEGYQACLWESANLQDLLSLAMVNENVIDKFIFGSSPARMLSCLRQLLRSNTLKGSRRNISAHYDLGNDFYSLWLDPSMTYSSALFCHPGQGLAEAQANKYDRILDHMGARSGTVLEIGCGWGGFAAHASERGDYSFKGITLSERQREYAAGKLGGNAHIALEDYRHQQGKYDSIVSIEMFEAVGERYWKTYFDKIAGLLKPGGRAVVQTITIADNRFERYRNSGDFIRKYIFPGGMLPSPSRFADAAARSGLRVADRFDFGQDYAQTLERWLGNFDARRLEVQDLGYDEGFIRMWRFYLAACIAGFRTRRTDVMQVELHHV